MCPTMLCYIPKLFMMSKNDCYVPFNDGQRDRVATSLEIMREKNSRLEEKVS